jgi:hypothetical protein
MSLRNPFADGVVGLLTSRFERLNLVTALKWVEKGKSGELLMRVTPPTDELYEHVRTAVLEDLRQGAQAAKEQAANAKRGHYRPGGVTVLPFKAYRQEMIVNGIRNLFLRIVPDNQGSATQ